MRRVTLKRAPERWSSLYLSVAATLPTAVAVAGWAWLCLISVLYLRDATVTATAGSLASARPALPTVVGLLLATLAGAAVGLLHRPMLARRCLLGALTLLAMTVAALAMVGQAPAFLVVAWLAVVAWAIGQRLLTWVLGPPDTASDGQRAVFAMGIGLGTLSHLVLGLGLLGLVGPGVYVGLLALLTALTIPQLRRLLVAVRQTRVSALIDGALLHQSWLTLGMTTIVVGWIAIALVEAVAPEVQYDSLYYHLALPRIWLDQGRISGVPYVSYSYFYLGTEMLYLLAMGLAGQTAARLTNVLVWLLVTVAVLTIGRRAFTTRSGLYGAMLTLTTPLLAMQGSSSNVDIAVAMYSFLAAAASYWWWVSGRAAWLVVAGALAGFALSTKLSALLSLGPLVLLIGAAIAWHSRLRVWRDWREISLFSAAFLLTAAPWPALQWVQAGNPAFPYLNAVFQSPLGIGLTGTGPGNYSNNFLVSSTGHDMFGIGTSVGSMLRLPWAITFDTPLFMEYSPPAALGLGFVLLPLLLVTRSVRHPAVVAGLLFALLCGVTWAFSGQAIRYGLAQIVPVNLLAGHALARFAHSRFGRLPVTLPRNAAGALVLCWCVASFPLYLSIFNFAPSILPYAVAFGWTSRDAYLASELHTYPAYQFMKADSGNGTPRALNLAIEAPRLYAPGELITEHFLPVSQVLTQVTDDGVLHNLRVLGFSYVVLDRTGLVPFMSERLVGQDAFLDRALELRYADQNVQVYRVPEPGASVTPRALRNLLRDPSFDARAAASKGSKPTDWALAGAAEIRRDAPERRDGNAVARLSTGGSVAQTVEGITPGQFSALRQSVLGAGTDEMIRSRVVWLDSAGRTVSSSQNILSLPTTWQQQRLLATAPPGSTSARIELSSLEGEMWLEEVAFGPFD